MDQTQLKAPSHPPADTPLPGESTSEQAPTKTPKIRPKHRPPSRRAPAQQPERQGKGHQEKVGGESIELLSPPPWGPCLPWGPCHRSPKSPPPSQSPARSHSLTSSHLRLPLRQVFRKHTAWRMLQGSELGAAGWEAGGWAALVPAPQGFWLASAGGSARPHILLVQRREGGREEGGAGRWEGGRRRLAPRRAGKRLRAARRGGPGLLRRCHP